MDLNRKIWKLLVPAWGIRGKIKWTSILKLKESKIGSIVLFRGFLFLNLQSSLCPAKQSYSVEVGMKKSDEYTSVLHVYKHSHFEKLQEKA